VGQATITAGAGTLAATNYDFTNLADGTLTINKADAQLSASRSYDGTTDIAIGDISISGVNNETLLLSGSGTATIASKNVSANASNYITNLNGLSLSNGSGLASNYQLPSASSRSTHNSVTLTKAALTLAPLTDSKIYDGTVQSSAIVSIVGKAGGDTITVSEQFSSKDVLGANASTLLIKPGYTILDGSNADMSGNYTIVDTATASGTVTPKTVILSAQKTYDGTTNLTGFVTIDTGIANEALNFSGATSSDQNVATSSKFINAISLVNGTGGSTSNYQLPTLDATNAPVTINKAGLTVTADNKSRLYGEANPPLTTTVNGFVNHEDATTALGFGGAGTATTTATSATRVGPATISAGVGTLTAANYDFVAVNGTLLIEPLASMLIAPPPSRATHNPLATPDTDPPPIRTLQDWVTSAIDASSTDLPCVGRSIRVNKLCQPIK
jgi:hypothetical protein